MTEETETMHQEPSMSLEDLSSGEMPKASPHVVGENVSENTNTAHTPKPAQSPEAVKDKSGRKFNPAKHKLGPDGKPELTERGYFVSLGKNPDPATIERQKQSIGQKIKDGIKDLFNPAPKPQSSPFSETRAEDAPPEKEINPMDPNSYVPDFEAEASAASSAMENERAAAQTVVLEEMLAVMVFGEEWQFMSQERQGLVMAYARYYKENGVVEMPPWLDIVAAHGVIITKRLNKPQTKSKLSKFKGWFKKKVIDFQVGRQKTADPQKTRMGERAPDRGTPNNE